MLRSPPSVSNGEQVSHYEELRSRVVAGGIRGVRHGLVILMQMGMAAWMEAILSCPPVAGPTRHTSATSRQTRLPDERCPALVDLLANLALTRFTEIFTHDDAIREGYALAP